MAVVWGMPLVPALQEAVTKPSLPLGTGEPIRRSTNLGIRGCAGAVPLGREADLKQILGVGNTIYASGFRVQG